MDNRTDPIKEKAYEAKARQEIHDWEHKPLTRLQEAGEKFAQGMEKVGNAVGGAIPSSITDALTRAIEKILEGFSAVMNKTINPTSIESQVNANWDDADCCCELEARDWVAKKSANIHITAATSEGAAFGAGGIATTLADIPAFIGLALRAIAEVAVVYGYDPRKEEEKYYLFTVLAASFAVGNKAKREALLFLKALEKEFKRGTWKTINELLSKVFRAKSFDLRKLAEKFGISLTKKKAGQIIPVIGAVVGGATNGTMLYRITETAQMVYRRRWLADHRGLSTVDAAADD